MPNDPVRVLVTLPDDYVRKEIWPVQQCRRLESIAQVTYNPTDQQYTPEQLADELRDKHAVLTGWGTPRLTGQVIADADHLTFVGHAAGSVGSLASDALYDRGVVVTTANDVMARQVAEFNVMLMLMGFRKYRYFCDPMYAPDEDYKWPRGMAAGVRPLPMLGAKVGVIGLGAIGRWVIHMLKPMEPEILLYSRHATADSAARLGVKLVELDELLSTCDAINILCGLTDETYHLLNAERLAKIKDGAVLVNTGRGAIIDEQALIKALQTGRFIAALDVFATEPLPADSPLRKLPNVILTPHIAGGGNERNYSRYVIDELQRHLGGQPLQGAVARQLWANMTVHEVTARDSKKA